MTMTQYKSFTIRTSDLDKKLNQLADEGWALVTIITEGPQAIDLVAVMVRDDDDVSYHPDDYL